MQILPVKLMEAKEKYSTFFVHLIAIHLHSTTLRFALVDQDITFAGNAYTAFPVKLGAIKSTIDGKMDNVDITISDVTNAFKIALLRGEDFRGSTMEVHRISYPESLTDATLFQPLFRGELDSPRLDDGKSEFSCVARQLMSNYETGRTLMLNCNNVFGDEDCGIAKEVIDGTVGTGSTQTNIVIQGSYPVGHWTHGIMTINGQSIAVIASANNTVTTEFPFYGAPSGAYTLESGCSKGFKYCKERYDNQRNYSGCPAIPWENTVKT